mmetsp:Transcript_27021/g.38732  ORF Transcript_27021/g.38732 Transcript_27021/m.38732 type:complete len:462 (-) Transcript_27021:93-1478(-)
MMMKTTAVRFLRLLFLTAFQCVFFSFFEVSAFVVIVHPPPTLPARKNMILAFRDANNCAITRVTLDKRQTNIQSLLQVKGSDSDAIINKSPNLNNVKRIFAVAAATIILASIGTATSSATADSTTSNTSGTSSTTKTYDGFASYAKENKMEQSDVKCFIQQCGEETKALFANPRGIKGVSCLGRCKGEQSCATRCFAEYGSTDLNKWLSCTIEENECVKVPKTNLDNSDENVGFVATSNKLVFDPTTLVGTWYKTNGLNPNYDLFDCQTNVFTAPPSTANSNNNKKPSELDMGIFFRVLRPKEAGGGYWENQLTEHMVIDDVKDNPTGRTMHTSGKMYGLQFDENWYILGESDGSSDTPPFKLVAYKGHTLQGNYQGAFVYAKQPVLPEKSIPAIRKACEEAGLNFDDFVQINNSCPTFEKALNDPTAGTGTTTTDWVNLVIGEGGVIDWIIPGWRGEYNK